MDPDRVCRRLRHARGRRSRICRRQPEVIEQVHKGVALATKECQHQFQHRRWNCTTDRRSLKRILMKGERARGAASAARGSRWRHVEGRG